MCRLYSSLAALVLAAALAAPASAADWEEDDMGFGEPLRGSYLNEPKDWMGMGDELDPLHFELGLRYWYSWGAQNFSSGGGSLSSTDQAHIGEVHLRIEDWSSNSFVKAMAGYSIAVTGSFIAPLDSGDIQSGEVGYAALDFGWNPWGEDGSGFGGLVGYQYWNNSPDTGRNNFTTAESGADIPFDPVTGQTFLPGDSSPNNVNINMLRLGIQGKAKFNDFFDISGELVGVPYAHVAGVVGVDDPSFDASVYGGPAQPPYDGVALGNIDFIRSSPTEIEGWGYGAMAEVWLGMHPMENMTFRVGGRAWYLQGVVDATYTAASVGNPSESGGPGTGFDTDPTFVEGGFIETNNPFSMLRYGLLAELTYSF